MTIKKDNDDGTIFSIIDAPEELQNLVKGIPYIETNVPFNKKATKERENRIVDHIIKKLPEDNDRDYIEHEDGSQTFTISENPKQRGKDRLIELITNTKKRLSRSKKKSEKTKLRYIKGQAIRKRICRIVDI